MLVFGLLSRLLTLFGLELALDGISLFGSFCFDRGSFGLFGFFSFLGVGILLGLEVFGSLLLLLILRIFLLELLQPSFQFLDLFVLFFEKIFVRLLFLLLL